jgi:putative transposase
MRGHSEHFIRILLILFLQFMYSFVLCFAVILYSVLRWKLRILFCGKFHHRARSTVLDATKSRTGFRSRKKPDWVIRELIKLATNYPHGTGCRTLSMTFNRRFSVKRGVTVSKSFVNYTLRHHRYEIAQLHKALKHRVPPAMKNNQIWGLDLTGKGATSGEIHSIIAILDHGSRRALSLTTVARACSWTLLGCLCFAIARHGKPHPIRTDNGANLTLRVFRYFLKSLGIKHERTDVGCPWQNGRVERFFGTLKSKLNLIHVDDKFQLQSLLNEFSLWYNAIRPHQHLQGRTPVETWNGVDTSSKPTTSAIMWQGWNGLLMGVVLRQ